MSPVCNIDFILHRPMAAVADVLTDNENLGQLSDLKKSGSQSTFYYQALFLCTGLKVTKCHFYFYNSNCGFLLAISISNPKYFLHPPPPIKPVKYL